MLRSVIIDDEPKNVRILRNMLEEFCPQVTVMAEAGNANQGVEVILEAKPELVFLDIEMPYGSAFDMLDKLYPVTFEIIFVTAFNSYMLKAFKYSALDYLLKPVNIEELKAAVNKAAEKINFKKFNKQLFNLLENLKKAQSTLPKLAIPSQSGLEFVQVDEIIRCEAEGGYTFFHTKAREKIVSVRNIKEYEELLPEALFFRIHNSHLINLNFIKKYHKGRGGFVEMEDGFMIEVATRRKDEFLAKFNI